MWNQNKLKRSRSLSKKSNKSINKSKSIKNFMDVDSKPIKKAIIKTSKSIKDRACSLFNGSKSCLSKEHNTSSKEPINFW